MIDASKVKVNRTYADRKPANPNLRYHHVCRFCRKFGSGFQYVKDQETRGTVRVGGTIRTLFNEKGEVIGYAHEICMKRAGLLK